MNIVENIAVEMSEVSLSSGDLVITKEEGRRIGFKLSQLTTGFSQPYPYDKLKQVSLNLPDCEPALEYRGNLIAFSRSLGKAVLKQYVNIEYDACVIESFIENPEHCELPRSIDLLQASHQQFQPDSHILFNNGAMGSLSIKGAHDFVEGDLAKSLFAVQTDEYALVVNSEIGSSYPLYLGLFDDIWYGMVVLPPKSEEEIIRLGKIEIRIGKCAQAMLEDFASRTKPTDSFKRSPKCWNSWDFYHSSISQEKIIQNVHAIAADPVLRDEIECIVIDGGWEVRFGEWVGDPNFPSGMAKTAKSITDNGFSAGLWFAPVIIEPECNCFQENYNVVGKNSYGYPDRTYECCGVFGYILDVTLPEGENYLRNLFQSYRKMGFTYFKLDFLRFMMFVHHFHDKSLTNVQVMQQTLRIIREAVGEEAYILGCNLPFETGPGYCDACRVSDDVSIFWDSIKLNARSICSSYFLNSKWWYNDPDSLVARGRDTYVGSEPIYRTWWFPREDEFEFNLNYYRRIHSIECTLSLEEARTHSSLELVNGGAFVLGDPVMYLNDDGLRILRKVMSSETSPGRPIDLFAQNGLPTIWRQGLSDRVRIGIFNWDDEEQAVSLDSNKLDIALKDFTILDYWAEHELQFDADKIEFCISPHSCRVIELVR